MQKWILILFLFIVFNNIQAQQNYWQQQVNYTIDVSLNDKENTLDGFETMEYINNSPDTLHYIWIHLWMNAYKNDKTAFSEQLLQNGNTKFYFSNEAQKGYINRLNFQANKNTLTITDHPNYIDIVKVNLSEPLAPTKSTIITTPFHVKLPFNFSRGGYYNQSYQVTQWFPKAALYNKDGWHEMPYLDQGEFFSDFGNYTVSITVPNNYAVAATGELQNEEEKIWLKNRENFSYVKPKISKNTSSTKKIFVPNIESSNTLKTITYKQNNVIDFAWFADKEFIVKSNEIELPSGKKVFCSNFYRKENEKYWDTALQIMKNTILFRSKKIGEYPFATSTIVDATMGFTGGMEYPTITSITGKANFEFMVEHELGHNWFQGILATNEREYPWLDEGVNSYYDDEYENNKNKSTLKLKKSKKIFTIPNFSEAINSYKTLAAFHIDQPINTNSTNFTFYNYNLIGYNKTASWLKFVEQKIGNESLDSTIQEYYTKWKFKHPEPSDFDNMFNKYSIYKDSLQNLRNTTGIINPKKTKSFGLAAPLFGYNKNNSFMLGFGVHNYAENMKNFRFLILPLYSFKTNNINGLGKFVYNYFPTKSKFERIDIGLNVEKFNENSFKDVHSNLQLSFTKLVPFFRFTFKEKSANSPFIKTIQFKHFNITEDVLNFSLFDNAPIDTFYLARKSPNNYYINQLQFNWKRTGVLYPYSLQLQMEQNPDLLRTTITADQFFNYNAKNEGVYVRLFAGKISYFKTKNSTTQYNNDRYALNLLGAKGNEDYTYSTYFMGRNVFEGGMSKQILQRDGFFKFRTDFLANKPGRTDNWLASANIVTDIPSMYNPLSVLPIKIPIKIFADIGTYAEAWQKNSGDNKFIFDAGLQISILKNTIEIYLPLVYSKIFTDYSSQFYNKKASTKNISFSINLNNFTLRKFVPQINF